MKILVVQETDWLNRNPILHHRMLETLALGGDEVVVLDHDILWRRNGVRPLLQHRRTVRDAAKFFEGSGVVVVRPAMVRIPGLARPTWLAMTILELIRTFRRFRPDVVVAYGLSNALAARLLAFAYGVPFVFHIFDSLHRLAEPGYLAPVARLVESAVLRSAGSVIVVHRAMLDYVKGMGVRRSKVTFIMNGFTVRRQDEARAAAERASLGVADDEVMVLFVGWLYEHSGLREAASMLVESTSLGKVRLVIAGDGDLLAELRDLASNADHGDRLIVLGRVPVTRVAELVAAADVGLATSDPSATVMQLIVPAKVDEYLEAERPVIATRQPGMLAELRDVPSMLWIDHPADALPCLARVLEGHVDPRGHLRELGAASRAYGARRETWAQVTARFRDVLVTAIARHRAG